MQETAVRPRFIVAVVVCGLLVAAPSSAAGPDEETAKLIRELNLEEAEHPVSDWPRWRKPGKVHIITGRIGSPESERLLAFAREVAGDVELVPVTPPFDAGTLEEMEVLIGSCTPEIVRRAKNLRWLQNPSHGVERCMIPEMKEANFILTNAQHTLAPPIAEHVIAMMMAMTRGLHFLHEAQLRGEWIRGEIDFRMTEVAGKTMLVAGLGGIGTEVARRANALGMRVVATRNSSREGPDFVDYVGLADELHELAGEADVVVNALPLTDETRGLFDEKFFDAVKPGGYFITVGRGQSTVTEDLIAALKDGRIAGAGMDVFDPEPLPPGHELWTMSNVIISPHISGMSDGEVDRRWLMMRENLRRYINGERLLNVVDTELGY
jgi:phosphoglycerate dehydrogenase-like enzyme